MSTDTPAAAPITAEREAFERLLEHVDTWPGTIDYHGLPKWIKRLDELRVEARAALSAPVAAPPADPLLGQALAALMRYANACDADAPTVAVIQALEARIDAAPPAASGVDALWVAELLLSLAKVSGATTYTNRHLPGEPAVAFGNESWARFCETLRRHLSTALTGAAKDTK